MNYRAKAKIFWESDFWMAGVGHFTLSLSEVIEIFRILDNPKPKKELQKLYDVLKLK